MQECLHEIRADLIDLIQLLVDLRCQGRSVVILLTKLYKYIYKLDIREQKMLICVLRSAVADRPVC